MADRRNDSAEGISRRAFLAASSAGLIAGPLLSTLAAQPISPEPSAPAPPVLRPAPWKRITELPAELLKHVHPDVRYVRVELPDEQNALPLLQAANKKYLDYVDFLSKPPYKLDLVFESPLYKEFEAFEKGGPLPGGEAGDVIRKWIEANQPVVMLMDEAVARGRLQVSAHHLLNYMDEMQQLESDPMRWCSPLPRFQGLRARLLLADGDHKRAASEVVQVLKLGQLTAETDGFLIHRIFGQGMQRRALDLIHKLACHGGVPHEMISFWTKEVPKYEPTVESLKRIQRIECCYWLVPELNQLPEGPTATLVDTFMVRFMAVVLAFDIETRKILGVGDDDIRAVRQGLNAILKDHLRPLDKAGTVRIASKIVADLIRDLDRPYPARRRDTAADVAKQIDSWPPYLRLSETPLDFLFGNKTLTPPTDQQLVAARQALANVDNPLGKQIAADITSYNEVLASAERHRACFAATRIVLACRRKLDRDGKLPEQLEDLVRDKFIGSIPLDPFDGQPFRYSRERALIWSIGPDGKDDKGDWDFEAEWPTGKDLVWKLPQPKRPAK